MSNDSVFSKEAEATKTPWDDIECPVEITQSLPKSIYKQMIYRDIEKPLCLFCAKVIEEYLLKYGKLKLTSVSDLTAYTLFFYGCYIGNLSVAVTAKALHEGIIHGEDLTTYRNVPF